MRHFRRSIDLVRGSHLQLTAADFEVVREGMRPLDIVYTVEQACSLIELRRNGTTDHSRIVRFTQVGHMS